MEEEKKDGYEVAVDENTVVSQLVKEVFKKAQKDCGSTVRNTVVGYVHNQMVALFNENPKFGVVISVKTLERYYRRYMEHMKDKDVEGFSPPNDRSKLQLSKYLGYNNYNEYLAHIYKGSGNTNINIAKNINNIKKHKGDINMS
ncbi:MULTISPECIES: hypothetical protein [unclassified Chryseobacterium]|uniref:hypothetical protein n=1 Tax=unclassified Chryseobacterium TaxID=2593645 RepID=UPI000D33B0D3|nr:MULTISPECIES: hypothetical protein [unclassified Chryseobacterium]PTT76541.1 hypothetical protein DBR25_05510 [Chryseobacterium sp. HMWF001]PVV55574.1 hypothetical protein DD829_13975 [Chryseobacterium sp. HMWF035]